MIPDQRLADIDGPPARNTRSRDRRGAPFLIGEFRRGRPIPPAPAPQVIPRPPPLPPFLLHPPLHPPLHPNRRLGDLVCPGPIPAVRRGQKREAPPGPTEGEPPCKRRRLNPRVGTAGGALPPDAHQAEGGSIPRPPPPLHPNRRLGDLVCPGPIPAVRRGRKRGAPPGPTEGEPPCKRRRLNPQVGTAGGALPQVTPEGLAEAPPLPPPTGVATPPLRADRCRPPASAGLATVLDSAWCMARHFGRTLVECAQTAWSSLKRLSQGVYAKLRQSAPERHVMPQTRSRAEVWASRWPRGRPPIRP